MNVLVVGGEGYIGKILIKDLIINYDVTSIDNLIYGQNSEDYTNNYTFINLDIRELKKMKSIIKNFDIIILLAGLVGDPVTKKYQILSKSINDEAVLNIINLCDELNTKRFIFVSTCSNYGFLSDEYEANEQTILKPLSLYSKSKVEAEKLILSKKNKTLMNPTILRFATAFGVSPRMRFDLTVSEFVKEIYFGNTLEVYFPNTWRPYCHVKDFSNLIQKVISAPIEDVSFKVYNAGSNSNNASKQIILDKILKYLPNGLYKYINVGDDQRNYKVNFNKVREELDFKPEYTIDFGIEELIDHFKKGYFLDVNKNLNKYGNYAIK